MSLMGLDAITTVWTFIIWPGVVLLGIVIGALFIAKMKIRRKPEGHTISGYDMTLVKK